MIKQNFVFRGPHSSFRYVCGISSTNTEINKSRKSGHNIIKKLMINYSLKNTYKIPHRNLTFPNVGIYNDGFDNYYNELILRVHDQIINQTKVYVIQDLIGRGEFGQVVQATCDHKNYAIKVINIQLLLFLFLCQIIKNIPVYNYQALNEISLLKQVNQKNEEERIVNLLDQFIYQGHICLVFPLLHISLFDRLQQGGFRGLRIELIMTLMRQVVEGIHALHNLGIIHCDLKPENVLLTSRTSETIKIIDLGSSYQENKNFFFHYAQSLFYRAPEVILGARPSPEIDIWSVGCLAAELYLGQPLFAGTSPHEQITRILELIEIDTDETPQTPNWKKFLTHRTPKSREQFEQQNKITLPPPNNLYVFKSLDQISQYKSKETDCTKLLQQIQEVIHRNKFIDFLKRTLVFNPKNRISSRDALDHPFIAQSSINLPSVQSLINIKFLDTTNQKT